MWVRHRWVQQWRPHLIAVYVHCGCVSQMWMSAAVETTTAASCATTRQALTTVPVHRASLWPQTKHPAWARELFVFFLSHLQTRKKTTYTAVYIIRNHLLTSVLSLMKCHENKFAKRLHMELVIRNLGLETFPRIYWGSDTIYAKSIQYLCQEASKKWFL